MIASLIAILFPPWISSTKQQGMVISSSREHHFIFTAQASSGFLNIFIDWQILLIEFLGIAILTGIALLKTYKK